MLIASLHYSNGIQENDLTLGEQEEKWQRKIYVVESFK
jgi:hypothetical protein